MLETVSRGKHLLTRVEGGTHAAHAPAHGRHVAPAPQRHAVDRRPRPPGAGRALDRRVGRRRLPPAGGRAPRDRDEHDGRRPPRPRPARSRRSTAPRRCVVCSDRARPRDRPGAARPAQPRRDRQPLQGGVTLRRTYVALDRRSATSRTSASSSTSHGASSSSTRAARRRRRPVISRPGRDHWVFERTGRPCRRCGGTVASGDAGRRRRTTGSPTGAPPASPARHRPPAPDPIRRRRR